MMTPSVYPVLRTSGCESKQLQLLPAKCSSNTNMLIPNEPLNVQSIPVVEKPISQRLSSALLLCSKSITRDLTHLHQRIRLFSFNNSFLHLNTSASLPIAPPNQICPKYLSCMSKPPCITAKPSPCFRITTPAPNKAPQQSR